MKVAVLLFDGVEELDFAGPYEVLSSVGEVFTVAGRPQVRGRHGLRVTPDHTFATAPQPNVLVVPGGPVTRENPAALSDSVAWVRAVEPGCRMVLSVCTGSFILARAGLLDGKHCTTHYRRRHLMSAQFPAAKLRYARVVADGRLVTTAGVSAGIDGSLFVISRLLGQAEARQIAKRIEYPWHPVQAVQEGSMINPLNEADAPARSWAW